jgi:hypothetical protein
MTSSETPSPPGRRLRYFLISLAAFAMTVALFYAEEDWRGWRAWENCKRELKAKGVVLDWSAFIPPPVPEDQNVFGMPEMQRWFEGRGGNEFTKKLSFPGWNNNTNMLLVVANVTIGLPGTTPPSGSTVLHWVDGKMAEAEAARLMNQARGPTGVDPREPGPFFPIMAKKPDEVRPAQIFLQCQTAPTLKELEAFLCKQLGPKSDGAGAQLEPTGANSYRVATRERYAAADYVAWNQSMEPDLAFTHRAFQRPYARLEGNYDDYPGLIPNFVAMRFLSQHLAALAECYMVLGQPGKALDELTFLNQVRRSLEFRPSRQRMTLVAAMINVSIAGLYVQIIEDGMRLQVWREPQLAALQEQLKEINLRPYVADGIAFELPAAVHHVEMLSKPEQRKFIWSEYGRLPSLSGNSGTNNSIQLWLTRLMPQGWIGQNLAILAKAENIVTEGLPREGQNIVPHKIDAAMTAVNAITAHPTPFNMLADIAIPNFSRSQRTTAHNQTQVNQARIVCALERYRLAHGGYPGTLDVLVPQFIDAIPHDIIGGQPPHYRRNSDGTFLLYSIGWSERDHGGLAGDQNDYSQTNSDLVWPEKWP